MRKGIMYAPVLVMLMAAVAMALPLPTNTTGYKPGTAPPLLPPYYTAGMPVLGPLQATMSSPILGAITGTVNSWVYANAQPGMTFVYEFISAGGNPIALATMGGAAWAGVNIVDCGAGGTGGVSTPIGVPSWANGDPNYLQRAFDDGIGIGFRDGAGNGTMLAPGNVSSLIWFETTHNSWATANVGVIDSGQVGSGRALAPFQLDDGEKPVPEPGLLVLVAGGLVGLVARRRS